MKVERNEFSNAQVISQLKEITGDNKDVKVNIHEETNLTDGQKKALETLLQESVKKANDNLIDRYVEIECSVHEETNRLMIKVYDRDTKEIIREIPPGDVLDMVAKMWEMAGIIIDEKG